MAEGCGTAKSRGAEASEGSSFTVRIDCMQATTASKRGPASTTRPKPAARARSAMRGWVATARECDERPACRRRARGCSIASALLKSQATSASASARRQPLRLGRRSRAPRAGTPAAPRPSRRLAQALGEPVAAAVAADDEHARAAPVARLAAAPRATPSRAAARRSRARRSPPRRPRRRATPRSSPVPVLRRRRRPARRASGGRAAKKWSTALVLTKTTRRRAASPAQARCRPRRSAGAHDRDQRQRLGVDAGGAQPLDPDRRLRCRTGDENARSARRAHSRSASAPRLSAAAR